jgi:4-hydroxy-3-methylbut-2-enyl diphosphate reductase
VVNTLADVAALPADITPGVLAQTTVTEETFRTLTGALIARYPHCVIHDTVCSATRERQDAAARLARTVDVVYVVGGRHSSNTNRLAEICRQACPRTHLIETADEIDPADLHDAPRVGITAGASTPAWLIDAVVERLKAVGQ